MRAVIFANGELDHPETPHTLLRPDDLIIAADGGGKHCQALGVTPHVLIGDFDSLLPAELVAFEQAGARVIRHPTHKDSTDLELALHFALENGAQEIVVFAALGARWDQSLANLLLPAIVSLRDANIRLVDGPQEMQLLCGGRELHVTGQPGDVISLIPLAGDAGGVSTLGLEYPLVNEPLLFGSTRGISNVLLATDATITLAAGMLLVVVNHAPGR